MARGARVSQRQSMWPEVQGSVNARLYRVGLQQGYRGSQPSLLYSPTHVETYSQKTSQHRDGILAPRLSSRVHCLISHYHTTARQSSGKRSVIPTTSRAFLHQQRSESRVVADISFIVHVINRYFVTQVEIETVHHVTRISG